MLKAYSQTLKKSLNVFHWMGKKQNEPKQKLAIFMMLNYLHKIVR